MSTTICPACAQAIDWSWEDAFDKFGFNDGDGLVMTEHVAAALRKARCRVTTESWGIHNIVITSIRQRRRELIPETANVGYDDPRDYLPARIVRFLDKQFSNDTEVCP